MSHTGAPPGVAGRGSVIEAATDVSCPSAGHAVPGNSHQFVGADNGDVNISVFLLSVLDVHLSPRFNQENLS